MSVSCLHCARVRRGLAIVCMDHPTVHPEGDEARGKARALMAAGPLFGIDAGDFRGTRYPPEKT